MTFEKALQILGIEAYKERIMKSNSHGELFFLQQYVTIAETFKDEDLSWFPKWFEFVVNAAEKEWKRPESIFQHIDTTLMEHLNEKQDFTE